MDSPFVLIFPVDQTNNHSVLSKKLEGSAQLLIKIQWIKLLTETSKHIFRQETLTHGGLG